LTSVFEIFKIGIGPSSSHTVGPMRAARLFALGLDRRGLSRATARVQAHLYGSLALTGRGHGTDRAVLLGLEGHEPETVALDAIDGRVAAIVAEGRLRLLDRVAVVFAPDDLCFHPRESLPFHPNGMRFVALDASGGPLADETFYSIGGGFVVDASGRDLGPSKGRNEVPHPFASADELLQVANAHGSSIAGIVRANERSWRSDEAIARDLAAVASTMRASIARGLRTDGVLPGGLDVRRRAPHLARSIERERADDPLSVLDWVSVFAMAVNEENAAGGRVVTAPTNGAAGIVPAVLEYFVTLVGRSSPASVEAYLLTAGAVGILFKENASISGAEVGCQGEVGVACSMAAAGLAAVFGGTTAQVEQAAEIGMEHHLGLTCDPVAGLVQIPCIERNAVGAVKAVTAARLALAGDGTHKVTLDQVIETMRQTGLDMRSRYKETSLGGLAVNVTEC
jgi:L-serine dehydratase